MKFNRSIWLSKSLQNQQLFNIIKQFNKTKELKLLNLLNWK